MGVGFSNVVRAEVAREELIQRAFRSVGFVMITAGLEPGFQSGLSPTEREVYLKITNIAHLTGLRVFLIERGVVNFSAMRGDPLVPPAQRPDIFAFVAQSRDAGDMLQSNAKSEIRFSDDETYFVLKPGEPARIAVTSSDPRDPIFINRKKLNHNDSHLTYAEAVGLAVHELGNKLGERRDQNSIDSVAAKIQQFVERQTQVFSVSRGQLSITQFKDAGFDDFYQVSMAPEPGSTEKLWLSGDQGTVLIFENQNRVTDLTSSWIDSLRRVTLQKPVATPGYDWIQFCWQLSQDPQLIDDATTIRLEMSVVEKSASVPFMNVVTADPSRDRPWSKTVNGFLTKAIDRSRTAWSIDVSGDVPSLRRVSRKPWTLEDPSITVEKIKSEVRRDEIIFVYKIPPRYQIDGHLISVSVTPFLKIRFRGQPLEIQGRLISGQTDQFEFRIPAKGVEGQLEVVGLEFAGEWAKTLTYDNVIRVKALLPQNETLDLKGDSPAGTPAQQFALQNAIALSENALRFVFDSATELESLTLAASFVLEQKISTRAWPLPNLEMTYLLPVDERPLVISRDHLRQTQAGGTLTVDWNIDDGLRHEEFVELPVRIDTLKEILRRERGGVMLGNVAPQNPTQAIQTKVLTERRFSGLSAINQSLQITQTALSVNTSCHAIFNQ